MAVISPLLVEPWRRIRSRAPVPPPIASTGLMFSDFQAAAIPTDDWLWLQVTATTGSPASLTLLIELQSGPPVLCCGGAGGVLEASMAI